MNTICFIGTSLVNQCNVATSVRIAASTQSWIAWAQRLSGWKIEAPVWWDDTAVTGWEPSGVPGATRSFWGLNAGVSGQTAQQILDRVSDIAAIPAKEYWVDAGTNDMAGVLTAQEIHDLRMNICRGLRTRTGKVVKLFTILARATSSWADPSDARTKYKEVNRLAKAQDEFQVLDWNAGWTDETSDIDIPLAANTVDGIHFSAQGALSVGRTVASLVDHMPALSPAFCSPSENLLPFGFLDGTGGSNGTGSSGIIPDGVRVERSTGGTTIASTVTTVSEVKGSVLNSVFTPSGAAESSRCYIRTSSADTSHALAGKWVVATCKVKINQLAFDGINLYLDDQSATGIRAQDLYDGGDGFIEELPGGWIELRTPPLLLEDDSVEFRYRLEVYVDGEAGQDGDISVAEMGVIEVPSPVVRYLGATYTGNTEQMQVRQSGTGSLFLSVFN